MPVLPYREPGAPERPGSGVRLLLLPGLRAPVGCSEAWRVGATAVARMPWTCPACQTPIRYDGDRPRPGQVYRCCVCRLELVLLDHTGLLTVAPLPLDGVS